MNKQPPTNPINLIFFMKYLFYLKCFHAVIIRIPKRNISGHRYIFNIPWN